MDSDNNINEKNKEAKSIQKEQEHPVTLHNPLKDDDDKVFTQEDIDNEQKYKEALTERD